MAAAPDPAAPPPAPQKNFRSFGTRRGPCRFAVWIVTFCPPALAIQNMGPDALTSPPPVAHPGSTSSGDSRLRLSPFDSGAAAARFVTEAEPKPGGGH
jgi:hypothetical protein